MLTIPSNEKQAVLKRIYDLSKSFNVISYLKLDSITTISKRRIFHTRNINDPIGKMTIYQDQLKAIDKRISAYLLDL